MDADRGAGARAWSATACGTPGHRAGRRRRSTSRRPSPRVRFVDGGPSATPGSTCARASDARDARVPRLAAASSRTRSDDADRRPAAWTRCSRPFVEPTLVQPTFVVDYPEAALAAGQGAPRATRRSPSGSSCSCSGRELANAFSELNDPDDQRRRFEEQARQRAAGDDEAQPLDEDYSARWSTACRRPAASASGSTGCSCSSPISPRSAT